MQGPATALAARAQAMTDQPEQVRSGPYHTCLPPGVHSQEYVYARTPHSGAQIEQMCQEQLHS